MPEEVLDFTDVKEGVNFIRIPEGDYRFKVAQVDDKTKSKKSGNKMWTFDHEILDGPHAGQRIREYISLTPQALFKLRGLLEAIGLKVGRKKIKIDPQKLVGKTFGAYVQDGEPYGENSRIKSEIGHHMPLDAVSDAAPEAPATENLSNDTETGTGDDADEAKETEQAAEPDPEESKDVADQLETFDLDAL